MDKFLLPKVRLPRPYQQNIYKNGKLSSTVGSCAACTFTRILEVINYFKTGVYTNLSVGYMYGRHNRSDKKGAGMNEILVLDELLRFGTVPESMCNDYGEMPEIKTRIESRADLPELDKAAEEYKLTAWEDISAGKLESVKKYLNTYGLPLAGRTKKFGDNHVCLIVGYDGNNILWLDHDGTEDIHTSRYSKFTAVYFLDGGLGQMNDFKLFNGADDLKTWLARQSVSRKITTVQLHHTYSPSYKNVTGKNHLQLQQSMRDYHVQSRGFADIAQHFTIFPDGKIMTGRSLNAAPAGIKGCNTNGICIECLGNFDKGGDTMTDAQKQAIAAAVRVLLDRFKLTAGSVTYHAWWTADGKNLGDYISGKSAKTCPGTNFFGGNTKEAYEKNLRPIIEGKEEKVMLETGNDIVWELMNGRHKIEITEVERAIKAIDDAKKNAKFSSLYWILYKIVNK